MLEESSSLSLPATCFGSLRIIPLGPKLRSVSEAASPILQGLTRTSPPFSRTQKHIGQIPDEIIVDLFAFRRRFA